MQNKKNLVEKINWIELNEKKRNNVRIEISNFEKINKWKKKLN